MDFASLNAQVIEVRFYESGAKTVELEDREYLDSFSRKTTRYVNWELWLEHEAPEERIDFQIDAVWYGPDGEIFYEQTLDTYVEAGWDSSWHSFGAGWAKPGNWEVGTYELEFSVEGETIATASFEIY